MTGLGGTTPAGGDPLTGLRSQESVYWTRSAGWTVRSRLLFCALLAVGAGAGSTGLPHWSLLVVVTAAALVLTWCLLHWRLVIDRRAVRLVSAGRLVRLTVPLERVQAAETVPVRPVLEYGGWGLRVGWTGRWGVVLRAGEALQLRVSGQPLPLVATVPDARQAAALVNALRAQPPVRDSDAAHPEERS